MAASFAIPQFLQLVDSLSTVHACRKLTQAGERASAGKKWLAELLVQLGA